MGEPCMMYLLGTAAGVPVSASIARGTQAIGDTGAWEEVTTGSVRTADCPRAPRQGDALVEASGARWIVDHQDEVDGLHVLTLRQDPLP